MKNNLAFTIIVMFFAVACGSGKHASDMFEFDSKKDVYSNIVIYLNLESSSGKTIDIAGKEFIVEAYLTLNDEEQQVAIANIGSNPSMNWKVKLDGIETTRNIIARIPFDTDVGNDGLTLRAVIKGISTMTSLAESDDALDLSSMRAQIQPGTPAENNRIEISLASSLAMSLMDSASDKYLNSSGGKTFNDLLKSLKKVQIETEGLVKTGAKHSTGDLLSAIYIGMKHALVTDSTTQTKIVDILTASVDSKIQKASSDTSKVSIISKFTDAIKTYVKEVETAFQNNKSTLEGIFKANSYEYDNPPKSETFDGMVFAATSITFNDTDNRELYISGNITMGEPKVSSLLEGFYVYAGESTATKSKEKLLGKTSTSSPLKLTLSNSVAIPSNATHLWAYPIIEGEMIDAAAYATLSDDKTGSQTTGPTSPLISINSNDSWTNTTSVTLSLSATDAVGMYVTETSGCSSGGTWETYATSKSWTLTQTNATATVYVKYRDANNAESSCVSDSIVHDDVAPTSTSIAIDDDAATANSTSVTLTLAATGAAQMYVTNTSGCVSDGSWETYSTSKSWTIDQTDATATVYVKFKDSAQNESSCINDTITHETLTLIHVATTGDDTSGDGSTSAPYATIAKAITIANAASGAKEIRVGGGTYSISAGMSIGTNTSLMGSYDPSDFTSRDYTNHQSIIDFSAANSSSTTAITMASASRTVDGFKIMGTFSPDSITQMCVRIQSSGTFSNNHCSITIGDNSGATAVQISGTGTTPIVEKNTIEVLVSSGANTSATTLSISGTSSAKVRFNKITMSYDGRYVYGMQIQGGTNLYIYSNVLDIGSPSYTVNGGHGIDVTMPSGNLYFYNNTVRSGTQSGPNGYHYSAFIRSSGSASIYFDNNIIFSRNSAITTNRCLNVDSFASLKNNNIFDCASALYYDGSTSVNDIATINSLTNASDNISFDLVDEANTYFTNETSDWSLQTGGSGDFITVKTEGLDLGSDYITDYTGTSRTSSSATGWSMGAYEQDN